MILRTSKILASVILLASLLVSCSPAELAGGSYKGYIYLGNSTVADTSAIVALIPKGTSTVNLQVTGGVTETVDGISVATNQDIVNFSFEANITSPSAGDIVSVTGALQDKNLHLNFTYVVAQTGPGTYTMGSYTFKGTPM